MLRNHFFNHVAQTSPGPLSLEIVRAEGCYLIDNQGVKLLDLISGISVSGLGHRHPAVERAVQRQLKKYWHTLVYGEFVLAPQVKLARLLAKNLPKNLSSVYFTNSGTEAVEGAIKQVVDGDVVLAEAQVLKGFTKRLGLKKKIRDDDDGG